MINVQNWIMYHPYYDSDCQLGNTIRNAQKESIERENKGVPVDSDMMEAAFKASGNTSNTFPHLYSNTTDADFREASFVMAKGACVSEDLKRMWCDAGDGVTDVHEDVTDNYEFASSGDGSEEDHIEQDTSAVASTMALVRDANSIELTPKTNWLHRSIETAGRDRSAPPSNELKAEAYKVMKETFDLISNDKLCTEQDLLDLITSDYERRHKFIEEKSAQVGYQKNGGGYVLLKRSPVKTMTKPEKRLKGYAG